MNKCDFLVELWTEDLPVPVQEEGALKIESALTDFFKRQKISFSESKHFSSPRRLAVVVFNVDKFSKPEETVVKGPPASLSFVENGQPSAALKGFVKKYAGDLADVRVRSTDKGEYVFLEMRKPRRDTEDIIRSNIAEVLYSVKFEKTMRWAKYSFPRPVRNLVVMFGRKSLRISCFGINSSRMSRGFIAENIKITSPAEYETNLKRKRILADKLNRKDTLLKELQGAVRKPYKIEIEKMENLVDETVGTCEHPRALACDFNEKYLDIPAEFLESTLVSNQKCFPVVDAQGNLADKFVLVIDGDSSNAKSVKANYRRCVEARFEDTAFFWASDRKKALTDYYDDLKLINCQGKFKNLYEKAERVGKDAVKIAREYAPDEEKKISLIAKLLYCDIPTKMVAEFPDMHGIAGQYLAEGTLLDKGDKTLREAVTLFNLARTSSVCGLSDRLNTLKSFFSSGISPTTSKDPYGLKKTADEVLKIAVSSDIYFDLRKLFLLVFDDVSAEVSQNILIFLKDRFSVYLEKAHIGKDVAAMAIDKYEVPKKCLAIADALHEYRGEDPESFGRIVQTAKRADNILKQARSKGIKKAAVKEELFYENEEKNLFKELCGTKDAVYEKLSKNDYSGALKDLGGLKKPLDAFFEKVMIMAKDENIRDNRLALVGEVSVLFSAFGKFSQILGTSSACEAAQTDKKSKMQ